MSKRRSLNDRINTPIVGTITAFTTPKIEENETALDTDSSKNETVNAADISKSNDALNVTVTDIKSDAKDVTINNSKKDKQNETIYNTNNITDNVSNDTTENETEVITNSASKDESINETKNVTKNETNNVSKIVTNTKSIKIGNSVFKSTYTSEDEIKRAAYHLRQDTIDKIEKCSKLSGLKKAEFVDLILNNILTDILNKVDK